jgi:repressor LexA
MDVLTLRQWEIFNFLRDNYESFAYPPSLDQLCTALGMASRGSLYKHIMVLIEAVATISYMTIPDALKTDKPCYVLQVKGDSMIEAGIFDGDWVVIEQRDYADNGEIVVALIENSEATLKYIEQSAGQVFLLPANANMSALSYRPEQVAIQGVLVGQMRSYRSH